MRALLVFLFVLMLLPSALSDVVAEGDPCWRTEYRDVLEDAYVSSQHPDANYGSEDVLKIRSRNWIERSLLKLPPLTGRLGQARLFLCSGRRPQSDLLVGVYPVTGDWSEETVTWNSAPPFENAPVSSFFIPSAGYWVSADVTPLYAGGYGSLLLKWVDEETAGDFGFLRSRESGYAPYVELSWRPDGRLRLSVLESRWIDMVRLVIGEDNELRMALSLTMVNDTGWDLENVEVFYTYPENALFGRDYCWVDALPAGASFSEEAHYACGLAPPSLELAEEGHARWGFDLPITVDAASEPVLEEVWVRLPLSGLPRLGEVYEARVDGTSVPFSLSAGYAYLNCSSLRLPSKHTAEIWWRAPGAAPPPPPAPPLPSPPAPPSPFPFFLCLWGFSVLLSAVTVHYLGLSQRLTGIVGVLVAVLLALLPP